MSFDGQLTIDGVAYAICDLRDFDLADVPYAGRVLIEALARAGERDAAAAMARRLAAGEDAGVEIAFRPARLLMQDYTGVPSLVDLAAMRDRVADPSRVNPQIPTQLVVDHSLQVDVAGSPDAQALNEALELVRNRERYAFLRWAEQAFDNLRIVPPGQGIVHQVNLEQLATVVAVGAGPSLYPDTVIGTDSHTTMVNGLGVLGWGVGGLEAEAILLGLPVRTEVPPIVGVRLDGQRRPGVTATDLVLALTELLRARGVVGAILEMTGPGAARLSAPDRCTIANMAPEYGAMCAYFPVDAETLRYLRQTGRTGRELERVEAYCRHQGLFRTGDREPRFARVIDFDLAAVVPSVAGPNRPHQRRALDNLGTTPIAIAAITSCTSTSNPASMLAAGLVAKRAVERGLTVPPHVKTSLSPGSRAVTRYLADADLLRPLETLGFHVVGYGCATCNGGSGPIAIDGAAVLSGNRNFEGRIHPRVTDAYLASPPLVVAFALTGHLGLDLGLLAELWPDDDELAALVERVVTPDVFRVVDPPPAAWRAIDAATGPRYPWRDDSTYIQRPPWFDAPPPAAIVDARALIVLGDDVSTDHISPVGAITPESTAGRYLAARGVAPASFNSLGSRRGNHEVMARATLGAFEKADGTPRVIIAGHRYGMGSSRDWAARGPWCLGVRAVIAESFERIHRGNLVAMGILPIEAPGHGLDGTETFTIAAPAAPRAPVAVVARRPDGTARTIPGIARIDSDDELAIHRKGGMLPFLLGALALLLVFAAPAHAAPTIRAFPATPAPVIDGVLDDAAWDTVSPDASFTQRSPHEGSAPTQDTEVTVLVADDAVYIGARLHERPSDIVARLTTRDRDVDSDWLMVDIDSRHDRTTAYSFRVNAAGVQYDGLRYDDTKLDTDWDAVWKSAVHVDEHGWTAELRIPIGVLRFADADAAAGWGIQFTRYLSALHETAVWAYSPSAVPGYVSRFGTLDGVAEVKGHRSVELRPFTLLRMSTTDARTLDPLVPEAGLDLKLGLTSALTLDAAVNPDFGQVEADQVVLNLTRFETYQPEKRPFFAEGVDVLATPIEMFYSRRIGAVRSGVDGAQPARIWSAAKLAGHASRHLSVGVLEAVTGPETAGDTELAPITSYLVARGRYDAGTASYLGATVTALDRVRGTASIAELDHDAYAAGIDGQYQSASSEFRVSGHAVASERVGGPTHADADHHACMPSAGDLTCAPLVREDGTRRIPGVLGYGGLLAATYQGEHWFADGSYTGYSPDLDLDDVGYLADFGQHVYDIGAGYEERQGSGKVRGVRVRLGSRGRRDWDLVPIGSFNALDVRLEYRNFIAQTFELSLRSPGTWEPYETADGARLERHGLLGAKLGVESDSRQAIVLTGEVFARLDPGSQEVSAGATASLSATPASRLQLELIPEVGGDGHYLRMIDCKDDRGAACTVDSTHRSYRFAEQESGFLSLTGRMTLTFTNKVSVQAYAQVFHASGSYGPYQLATTGGGRPFIRFTDLMPGSGNADSFDEHAINASAILRWEFRPGSTLLAIYGHSPEEDHGVLKLTYFL